MTNEQLNEIARRATAVMYDTGAKLRLPPGDLAAVVSLVACNVNIWAHGAAGVEQLRTAADLAERHLLAAAERI